jgi:hypothetical protein
MSTEYRRGIPSTAHVEAATRLGLLWQSEVDRVWILQVEHGRIVSEWSEISDLADIARITWPARLEELGYHAMEYRPIRPDGTPVDWEVLDQEVPVAPRVRIAGRVPAAQGRLL